LPITIKPGAKGRALVRLAGGTPVIALRVAYEPTGGRPREQHLREVRIRRRGR